MPPARPAPVKHMKAVLLGWAGVLGLAGLSACTKGHHPALQPPVITRFEATPTRTELGTEVLLMAQFAHGEGVVDPGHMVVRNGQAVSVFPSETTTYTLTVTDPQGRKAQQKTTVALAPGLAITVQGHEGLAGQITVTGPNGYHRNLVASGLLPGLEPGAYTITAAPAVSGASTVHPWEPIQTVQLTTATAVRVHDPAPELTLRLPGEVPLEMVLIPAGHFTMGEDGPAVPQRFPNPSPAHPVAIRRAFYMAKGPTTQAQWAAITANDPSEVKQPGYAVTNVSHDDIQANFLPALNLALPDHAFRLPSEAEWEYACRAGTTTTYFHGQEQAGIWAYAWSIPDFQSQSHPAGHKSPNPWGLHDLAGLVFQWCQDRAHDGYLGAPSDGAPRTDDAPAPYTEHRILRGYSALGLNIPGGNPEGGSAIRWARRRTDRQWDAGFRLVATPRFIHINH